MTDTDTKQNESSGNPVFYNEVELLNPEQHEKLGITQIEHPYAFTKDTHVVPVTVPEFRLLAMSYPIVFGSMDPPMPMAVLGIENNKNLMVNAEGDWEPFAYVPSYVRRYPFAFAQQEEGDKLALCIDRSAPMLVENEGISLIENKELSEYGKQAFEFCQTFQRQMSATKQFSEILVEHDLLVTKEVTVSDEAKGEQQTLGAFIAVDEERLKKLPGDKIAKLHETGVLSAIYAHLLSLNNWQTLQLRRHALLQSS